MLTWKLEGAKLYCSRSSRFSACCFDSVRGEAKGQQNHVIVDHVDITLFYGVYDEREGLDEYTPLLLPRSRATNAAALP